MELRKALEQRTSVRNFLDTRLPLEDLKEMVRLAACAPSVNNYQPWKFYAITSKSLMENMAQVISRKIISIPANESKVAQNVKSQVEWYATFFKTAPVVFAVALEHYESILEKGVELNHDQINRMRNFPDIQSAGAAIQNLLLAATDMGYGACWMSAPMIAKEELEEMIGIKTPSQLIAFVTVGVPANPPVPKEKRPVDEIFELISE